MWKSTIAPALVVSTFWLIVGGATTYYLHWQSKSLDRILEENVSSIRAANQMQQMIWRIQSAALSEISVQNSIPESRLVALESQFEQSLLLAESTTSTEDERACVRRIREAFTDYSDRLRRTRADVAITAVRMAELLPVVSRIIVNCEEVIRINEHVISDTSRRRQRLTAWIVLGRAVTLVIGPSLGLLLGFRLASQLNRSMTNISVTLQTVAGDLEHKIGRLEITPQATLPSIQRQLDLVADRMRGIVKELDQAREETMRAERLAAVGELAAGVAHEIRNPLTSVKLLMQTMQHRLHQSMPTETFDVVLEEINRMETTIQGLLDFARPPKLHRARHDLSQIVRRAVNLIEGKARQVDVSIITHFPENPIWVDVDAEQLHQVCINLLLNGIESMLQGGRFDIFVELNDDAGTARVRFADSGEGIPDNVLPRLFEPFVTSKAHGTGLGLAVSRRIIANHSGQLTAERRTEGGTVLMIELPMDRVPLHQLESHAHLVTG